MFFNYYESSDNDNYRNELESKNENIILKIGINFKSWNQKVSLESHGSDTYCMLIILNIYTIFTINEYRLQDYYHNVQHFTMKIYCTSK